MTLGNPDGTGLRPAARGRTIPRWEADHVLISKLAAGCARKLLADGYSETTLSTYELTWGQFLAYLIGRGIADDLRHFTIEHVEGFRERLAEHGLHANTIGYRLGHLGTLAKFAMMSRDAKGRPLLVANPLQHVERPQKQRPEKKVLYLGEAQAILRVPVPPNERLARTIWAETALRVSELCRISVGDVALGPNKRAIISTTVKGRGRRSERIGIEVSDEATREIQDALLARNLPRPEEPLLVNQSGERYKRSALYQATIRWGRAAGITRAKINPHSIRHLWNTVARQEGLDQVTRAKLLNHADVRTLSSYDHVLPEETAAARETVRGVLRGGISHHPDSEPTTQNSMVDFLKSGGRLPS